MVGVHDPALKSAAGPEKDSILVCAPGTSQYKQNGT
jgi:hypothetical protein